MRFEHNVDGMDLLRKEESDPPLLVDLDCQECEENVTVLVRPHGTVEPWRCPTCYNAAVPSFPPGWRATPCRLSWSRYEP